MDSRQVRVARNEALFREVNERIQHVNRSLDGSGLADFICECGDESCTQPISMSLDEYEVLRSRSTQFAIAPGHVEVDVESVVQEGERYEVVEKNRGAAERIAIETDPRS